MSGTLNKVMLIGHLGDEVKMNYFEGGSSIALIACAILTESKIEIGFWTNSPAYSCKCKISLTFLSIFSLIILTLLFGVLRLLLPKLVSETFNP